MHWFTRISISRHAQDRYRERFLAGAEPSAGSICATLLTIIRESIPLDMDHRVKADLDGKHGEAEYRVHELHAMLPVIGDRNRGKGPERILRTVLDMREWDHHRGQFSVRTKDGQRVAVLHPPIDRDQRRKARRK